MGAPVDPITPRRREILFAVDRLTKRLDRRPTLGEVGREIGGKSGAWANLGVKALVAAGYLSRPTPIGAGAWRAGATLLRLTPFARMRLKLPLLVYVAWPIPRPEDPDDAHEHSRQVGLELARWVVESMPRAAPASPLLTPHRGAHQPALLAAAAELASHSDAVVIWRDLLLCGRTDVARANELLAPIALIDRETIAEISAGANPWDPRWRVGATALAFRVRNA